ncbi:MAG TPA: hypothetical protein VFE79_06205 [Paraburkholderia sp.]|nr:hypothetical protein [Paraburkholderia sp.]
MQYPQVFGSKVVEGEHRAPQETRCRDWHHGNGQTCETDPAVYVPPAVETVDVNETRRHDAVTDCLKSSGWSQTPGFSGASW